MSRRLLCSLLTLSVCLALPANAQDRPEVPAPVAVDSEGDTGEQGIQPIGGKDSGIETNSSRHEFQADEIGLVLRTLARQARINIVVSENVKGMVTLRLEDKTPREAIEVIVAAKGLVMDEVSGIFYIKTRDERANESIDRQLERLSESISKPLARFKGQYYDDLTAAGLPPDVAQQMVVSEKLSSSVIDPPVTSTPEAKSVTRSSSRFLSGWGEEVGFWTAVSGLGFGVIGIFPELLLHVALAIAVLIRARHAAARGERLTFFGPLLWCLVTLVGGLFAAAFYWLTQESSLKARFT